ncbi:MAG TPA: family 16 glycosylhydrolase [Acidimicrobiales bacterium]|nr:family 16 glycosylhydrolase [Acidimicrobiales bacterium]
MALIGGFTLVAAGAAPFALSNSASAVPSQSDRTATLSAHDSASAAYPVGVTDSAQPSGQAPPTTSAIRGYRLRSVTKFSGSSIPPGWIVFTGKPSGDPGDQWAANHVTVSNNMLELNSFQDPKFNNEWVTGGVCQCATAAHTYGAYFVRSRITGPGPTQVEMLWPTAGWPPEVDFAETYGATNLAQATLHYGNSNQTIHKNITINMTAWHTWGIVWTPTSITYTVDGRIWSTITESSIIPHQPMSLHIQQQTWCSSGSACPTSPQSTDINWVAEYTVGSTPATNTTAPTTTTTLLSTSTTTSTTTTTTTTTTTAPLTTSTAPISVGSFARNSALLSRSVKAEVRHLARVITDRHDSAVTFTGYANGAMGRARALALSIERANRVKWYLESQLASIGDHGVSVVAIGAGDDASSGVIAQADSGNVVALLK